MVWFCQYFSRTGNGVCFLKIGSWSVFENYFIALRYKFKYFIDIVWPGAIGVFHGQYFYFFRF